MNFTHITKSYKQYSRFSNVIILHNYSGQKQEISIDTILFMANKLYPNFTTFPTESPDLIQNDTLLSCHLQDQFHRA